MDYPVKPGNDRKGKMSGNDINKKVMAFVVVILRLDRSILKRDNRSRRQIARSSQAIAERGKCQKMIFHPVMLRLDRAIHYFLSRFLGYSGYAFGIFNLQNKNYLLR